MVENLMDKKELYVLLMSMLPVVELRGGIPLGLALGLSLGRSTLVSILGNLLIVPILLRFLKPIMSWFESTGLFKATIGWVKKRTLRKTKDKIKKYSTYGLFIFVAFPLPTTGAWTGCLAASLLKLDYKKSVLAISSGVVTSGLIVNLLIKNIS